MNQMISIGNNVLEQLMSLQATVLGKLDILPTGSVVMIAAIVLGLIVGLFGIKLIRLFTAVTGLGFGALLGIIISEHLGMADTTAIIVLIGCAVVFAFVSSFFVRIGTFIMIFFLGMNVCTFILEPNGDAALMTILCYAVPFVVAIISAVLYEPIVIILTCVIGGIMTGIGVVSLGGASDIWWMVFGMCAGFSVIGMMTQIIINGLSKGRSFRSKDDEEDDDEEDDEPSQIGDDTVSIDLDAE